MHSQAPRRTERVRGSRVTEAITPLASCTFSFQSPGGKLELRKGQDLVVAAFRVFRQRHPEARLIVAWHNSWLGHMRTIARSPHTRGETPGQVPRFP
jgi:hypothetical protein